MASATTKRISPSGSPNRTRSFFLGNVYDEYRAAPPEARSNVIRNNVAVQCQGIPKISEDMGERPPPTWQCRSCRSRLMFEFFGVQAGAEKSVASAPLMTSLDLPSRYDLPTTVSHVSTFAADRLGPDLRTC